MSSIESHKVIGEGTYGCVHKEALYCKSATGDKRNRNKLSKLMTSHDATGEMKEYVLIDNADRALQYYLGKPEQCEVSDNPTNLKAIKKCRQMGRQVLVDIEGYSLLLMGATNCTYVRRNVFICNIISQRIFINGRGGEIIFFRKHKY